MKFEPNSLIDPILLFLLSQIAVVLPILIPFARASDLARRDPVAAVEAPAPKEEPAWNLEEMAAEKDRWAAEAARLRAVATGLAQGTETAAARRAEADQQAAEEQARQEALRRQAAEMDRQQGRQAAQSRESAESARRKEDEARQVSQALAERRSQIGALERELAEIQKRSGKGPVVNPDSNKKKLWLELFNRRVLPVEEPYYSVQRGFVPGGAPAVQYTRQHAGEILADLDKPGGLMSQWLRGKNPAQNYVACLVHRDSFGTYLELRERLWAKGFEVGWEPLEEDRGRLIFGAGGGGCKGGACPQ